MKFKDRKLERRVDSERRNDAVTDDAALAYCLRRGRVLASEPILAHPKVSTADNGEAS